MKDCTNISEADECCVLAICQDIMFCASQGRSKIPKHIALAMSLQNGSKQMITMLNRMGHCISYNETESLDTSLANEVLSKSAEFGAVIPSGIRLGPFIQAAADNFDLKKDTLDGKNSTHATTLVLFQKGSFGEGPLPITRASGANP
jgi:hypothetical protein